jgi:hypothetical protein
MAAQPTTATRSYRIYLREAANAMSRVYDVDLGSDEDAPQLAAVMLNEQAIYPCAEGLGSDPARLQRAQRRIDMPTCGSPQGIAGNRDPLGGPQGCEGP